MYEELIELLYAIALVDKSSPPCWRTNEVLGAIEHMIMVTRNQYAEFARIASAVLEKLGGKGDPEVRALLQLAVLNGRRRDDVEDVAAVQSLFDEVSGDVGKLDEGPRKQRCYGFFQYQQKVFGARCGFYAEAAKAAEAEATLGAKPEDRAISLYIAKVYAMWAAIMTGARAEIDGAFVALQAELPRLQRGVAGTALEVQWGRANGPLRLMQAMILGNIQDKGLWDSAIATVLPHVDELADAYKPGVGVLLAEQCRQNGDALGAIADVYDKVIAHKACSQADKAWAYLVLARTQSKIDPAGAAKTYAKIIPVPDAHVVAAVAARELALLPASP